MSRPATITDRQILTAARTVFLEKGIRATTAEVARTAGIAEGSIFKRFRTKAELFRAAMAPTFDEPAWLESLVRRMGKGDVRTVLAEVGLEAVEFFRTLLPLLMMSWSNPEPGSCATLEQPHPPALRGLQRVSEFFAAEMATGRLRPHDPQILSRVFLGSIQNFVFFELLQKAQNRAPMPADIFLRGLVQLLWEGAQPTAPRRRKSAP